MEYFRRIYDKPATAVITIAKIFISLFPVLLFLFVLVILDSYKLLKFKSILKTLFIGCLVALLCYVINKILFNFSEHPSTITYYFAPFIEEFLKALFPIYLIKKKKIGFLVDAAIYGFAIGAGFAFVENIYYLHYLLDNNMFIWIIRGFGTAIMHGGTTAIFTMITVYLIERNNSEKFVFFLPGYLIAFLLHSFFNHFYFSPMITTVTQLLLLPILMMVIFSKSEKGLQNWMETGFITDVMLLEFIKKGKFKETKAGKYLDRFTKRFPGEVVMDMLCYLRIYLELSIRSKGLLLLKEAGMEITIDAELKDKLKELSYLEKSIGSVGKRILAPLLHTSKKDLWQISFLKESVKIK